MASTLSSGPVTSEIDPTKVSYKVKELVKATGLSRTTVYALITSGEACQRADIAHFWPEVDR
jgi:predicted DNA-binding transcriptional regulator AlpA